MSGRIIKLVGLVVLTVIVAAVLSPCLIYNRLLGRSHRTTVQFSLAVTLFLPGAVHTFPTLLVTPRTVQLRRAFDILTRDCADCVGIFANIPTPLPVLVG